MNEENDISCFGIICCLIAVLFIFGSGWCVGNHTTAQNIRQDICKNIMAQTSDYINCNTWDMDKIYKNLQKK